MAERHIQTTKNIMRKVLGENKDISMALVQYRNTPVAEGLSPSQLLMSRVLGCNLTVAITNLKA